MGSPDGDKTLLALKAGSIHRLPMAYGGYVGGYTYRGELEGRPIEEGYVEYVDTAFDKEKTLTADTWAGMTVNERLYFSENRRV